MARRSGSKNRSRRPRGGPSAKRRRAPRGPFPALARLPRRLPVRLPSRRTRRRIARGLRRAWSGLPDALQWPIGLALAALALVALNLVVQVARKPTELYYPIEDSLAKSYAETWDAYGHLFERHSTAIVTADLLAGLAQIEAGGNPVARTYWRFDWSGNPFAIYRPASSAVGLFQIIDGTFEEASRYCIHDHRVVEEGPWHDWDSCWANELYFRVIPSHAIELASANLHRSVERALRRHPVRGATLRQKQDLAILSHLCGAGAGMAHARRGLRLVPGQRCGSHDAFRYVAKVRMAQARFVRLAASER